jgi:hypothetical protein
MINIREVIRRIIKYLVLVLVVAFAAFSVPENKLKHMEVFWIAVIAGIIFSILDSVTPSIKIQIEKKEN